MDFATQIRQASASLIELIKPRAGLLAIAWMALIFALSSQQTLPETGVDTGLAAIVGHFIAFGVLAALLALFLERRGMGGPWVRPTAVLLTTLYGLTDEFHQSFVPGRDASLFDVGVDALGAVCAVMLLRMVQRPS